MFQKLDLFLSSSEGRETPAFLGLIEREIEVTSFQGIQQSVSLT
jgi:hypothetical protein